MAHACIAVEGGKRSRKTEGSCGRISMKYFYWTRKHLCLISCRNRGARQRRGIEIVTGVPFGENPEGRDQRAGFLMVKNSDPRRICWSGTVATKLTKRSAPIFPSWKKPLPKINRIFFLMRNIKKRKNRSKNKSSSQPY